MGRVPQLWVPVYGRAHVFDVSFDYQDFIFIHAKKNMAELWTAIPINSGTFAWHLNKHI